MRDYDTDFLSWSEHQAALLRRRAGGELIDDADLDWPNIAEEIETLGRSERSVLASCIGTVIEHLLKLEASPAITPRAGWKETIIRTRASIEDVLEASPCLRPTIDAAIVRSVTQRRKLVAEVLAVYGEAPRKPLENISYSVEQVLGPWFPEEAD